MDRRRSGMALENKLGITESADLAREEEKISKKKAIELFESGYLDSLEPGTYLSLAQIHKYLFEDVYDFAGKLRTVNLAKGSFRFAPLMYLEAALANIDKMPQYRKDLQNGDRRMVSLYEAKRLLENITKRYHVSIIVAHNAYFDYRSTNYTQRYLTKSKYRYFLPYGCELWDSLKMARATFKDDAAYTNFCQENNFLTDKGKPKLTAEVIYRYLFHDKDFIESHTGLEDCLIEKEIFTYCLNENPDLDGIAFKRKPVEPLYWWQK